MIGESKPKGLYDSLPIVSFAQTVLVSVLGICMLCHLWSRYVHIYMRVMHGVGMMYVCVYCLKSEDLYRYCLKALMVASFGSNLVRDPSSSRNQLTLALSTRRVPVEGLCPPLDTLQTMFSQFYYLRTNHRITGSTEEWPASASSMTNPLHIIMYSQHCGCCICPKLLVYILIGWINLNVIIL